jgi:hypothetical protein
MFVEIGIVDAHPPLVHILLADEDGVGEPLRIEDFSDEVGHDLLLDGVSSFIGKTAEMLSFRGSFRVDVE